MPDTIIATVEIKNKDLIKLLKRFKKERDWSYNMSIREALRLLAAQENNNG